jgi:hypothetical protein
LKSLREMQDIFIAIEQSALSVWMREDEYAYFIALIFHAFGMALLVGGGIVICLRALGIGKSAALERFRGFLPVMWIGAVTAIASGVLLLAAYPAKAFTNPLFFVKLACLLTAALLMRSALGGNRKLAALALLLWLAGVAAGKLLLHTYTVLTVS